MKPALLIMAAGIGARYGGLKQIDRFGPSGESIIDYTLFDAFQIGFGRIVFVIRHDMENDFQEAIADKWKDCAPLEFAYQELNAVPSGFQIPPDRIKPWGTGHAILVAASKIDEPFCVVNADDFYGRASLKKVFDHLSSVQNPDRAEYCLAGYHLKNTLSEYGSVTRGVCHADDRGYLTDLLETASIFKDETGIFRKDEQGHLIPLDGNMLVSMNLWGFSRSFFDHLDTDFQVFLESRGRDPKAEFYLTISVDRLVRSGEEKVKVLATEQQWFGITYREDRPMVEKRIRELVAKSEYPENVWKSVSLNDPG